MSPRPHILFVCGRNLMRSPTAARAYANDPRVEVRSAGVSEASRHQLDRRDLAWADLILVMEQKYAARIRKTFRDLDLPPIESLEIPDEFVFMDDELVRLIREGTETSLSRSSDRTRLNVTQEKNGKPILFGLPAPLARGS